MKVGPNRLKNRMKCVLRCTCLFWILVRFKIKIRFTILLTAGYIDNARNRSSSAKSSIKNGLWFNKQFLEDKNVVVLMNYVTMVIIFDLLGIISTNTAESVHRTTLPKL